MHPGFAEHCPQCIAERKQREKEAATPSITVGAQVRLTGVVEMAYYDGSAAIVFEGGETSTNMDAREMKHAEVIRQPFKRGEVVWAINDPISDPWLLVADEKDGKALAVLESVQSGHTVVALNVDRYERRP